MERAKNLFSDTKEWLCGAPDFEGFGALDREAVQIELKDKLELFNCLNAYVMWKQVRQAHFEIANTEGEPLYKAIFDPTIPGFSVEPVIDDEDKPTLMTVKYFLPDYCKNSSLVGTLIHPYNEAIAYEVKESKENVVMRIQDTSKEENCVLVAFKPENLWAKFLKVFNRKKYGPEGVFSTESGDEVARLWPGWWGHDPIYQLVFSEDVAMETRAAVVGAALLITIQAFPEVENLVKVIANEDD